MAGVLFEDIFNVKDIDPEGKKFDRGESTFKFISRRIRGSPRSGGTRAIFTVKMTASCELVDLADSAGINEHMALQLSVLDLRSTRQALLLCHGQSYTTAGQLNRDTRELRRSPVCQPA